MPIINKGISLKLFKNNRVKLHANLTNKELHTPLLLLNKHSNTPSVGMFNTDSNKIFMREQANTLYKIHHLLFSKYSIDTVNEARGKSIYKKGIGKRA